MYLLLLVLFKCYFVAALKPVVLMPGLGGSQLEARLNKPKSDNIFCLRKRNWYPLWVDTVQLGFGYCLHENFRLEINENNGTTRNREGVEIRCPRFGDTFAVEYLGPYIDPITQSLLEYFVNIVDKLVRMGYVRNQSIRGAPYDFRKAPNEMAEYFDSLTKLIEETYERNDRKRVVMLGHSMGCLYTLYFLNHKNEAWKDKYVEAFIALAAPWHGSVRPVRLIASGDDLDLNKFLPIINTVEFRKAQQTMPSASWLMPSSVAWKSDEILVMGPQRNYSVNDYENFFNDVNFKNGMLLRRNTENLTRSLEYPGVRVYCIYGLKPNSTPDGFDYRRSKRNPWYDEQPLVINGMGDEMVNLRSLEACKYWLNTTVKIFENVGHVDMMDDKSVKNYITEILHELNKI